MKYLDLIIDVGMHDGSDTAYYLSRGFRVVAVDANPQLCDQARSLFRTELESGQLTILNVGIADSEGRMEFWINHDNSELSSFDRQMASRFGGRVTPVTVETQPFRQILNTYGVPHYLKIDIEGLDTMCLRDLDPSNLPNYLSVEGHSIDTLFLLYEKGYRDFKCVNQLWHSDPNRGINQSGPIRRSLREFREALGAGFVSMTDRFSFTRFLRHLAQRIWKAILRRTLGVPGPTQFSRTSPGPNSDGTHSPGTSGPFGEDTVGAWLTLEETAYDWLHLHMGFPWRSRLTTPGWHDFHTRRSDLEEAPEAAP